MSDMVNLGGKDNVLETRNCISSFNVQTLLLTFDLFTSKSIGNNSSSRGYSLYMCDMVTLSGKGLEIIFLL
jgi:hypothetical protein